LEHEPARVFTVNKDGYIIRNGQGELAAQVTGKLLYAAESGLDIPAVGDWVLVQSFDENMAVIHQVLDRKSLLKRKKPGRSIDYQAIAANIDVAFIMQSVDQNFNFPRLERYLVMVTESHIKPVILLSKTDLISAEEVQSLIDQIHQVHKTTPVIAMSNINRTGITEIQKQIRPGLTLCLLGSSGVGKTSLLNRLMDRDIFQTADVRAQDHKGRHTTSQRQLVVLPEGGLVIDTPGMRELGNFGMETGLTTIFSDIEELATDCKFRNCKHLTEPGCSVLAAVEKGEISRKHYDNYIKLRKESEHYQMSYTEKRKKDRERGKLYKNIMKEKQKK
jgi:ribosome biogenesis GTPase